MESPSTSFESSQEMLHIRHLRRFQLCNALTAIGSAFLLVFGTISVIDGAYLLGAILLVSMCVGLFNLYLLKQNRDIEQAVFILNGILFVLSLTLLITGGKENTGILWIYPITAINVFINRFWPAVYLYGAFLILSALLLFSPLSFLLQASYTQPEAIRFELTLLALCSICLAALRSQEQAYDMLIKIHDEDIHKLAYYDSLTGLHNRWSFQINLDRLLERTDESKSTALLYIDLDNFKQVNDNYGHEAGDRLLQRFSEQLELAVRPTDLIASDPSKSVARLAGDEFVVILNQLNAPEDASIVAQRILDLFDGGFESEGITHPVYSSIGIAIYPDDARNPTELLHHADAAMYQAKRSGNNNMRFFTTEIETALHERKRIENGLKEALKSDQLSLVYMPIYDCKSLEIVAIEALMRCNHPALEKIGPDRFIPVAESTGLVKELDLWALETSLIHLTLLRKDHQFTGKLCINISGIELLNDSFPSAVQSLIDEFFIDPKDLEFEITETALISDDDNALWTLQVISDMGISLALDDFGTGYTAFNQLINYPADCLKIDRSFINDLFSETSPRKKMIRIIQNLAEIYDLRVVAEGVETEQQLEFLQSTGCDWVQGYLLSRPLKLADLRRLLEGETSPRPPGA